MVVQSTERRRADRLQGTCRCIVAVMVAAISPLLLANTITVDDASSGSVPLPVYRQPPDAPVPLRGFQSGATSTETPT